MPEEIFNVDVLLDSLFPKEKLSVFFENRLKELDIAPTNALEIIGIEYRALQGIIYGTNKRVDYTNFTKIASFLKMPREKVISLYLDSLEKNFPETIPFPQNKIEFINSNFDLPTLKKDGFINSITDYQEIEQKINSFFGFKTIFEYKLPTNAVAFSAGVIQPKNIYTRGFWLRAAIETFKDINNPNVYDRERLLKYIPYIRKQSMNVECGLLSVIKDLYNLGVTVFYQDKFSSLHLRGASMCIDNKPCIVLTDYRGFYATLWFALMHEIHHILFDLDELKNSPHISYDEIEDFLVAEKEEESNDFAREYLFSIDKTRKARPHLNNSPFIEEIAERNGVHSSLIYTFYARDVGKENQKAWMRAKRNNPNIEMLIKPISNLWKKPKTIARFVKQIKETIYN
jgi:HTH-type transcriptional regulator / antitoxin HigA